MSDIIDRQKKRIEKEQKFYEDLWNTEANKESQIDKAIHNARNFLYRTIFSIFNEELAKEPQEESVCKHMCGKIHKNEVGEDIVFCELCDCDKNITLGDCLNNCDSQDNISEPQECNSDLISKKKLIRDLFYSADGNRYPTRDCDNFPITISFEDLRKAINNQQQVQPIVRSAEEVVEMLNKISCSECEKNSSHCHFSESDCKNYWYEWLTKKEV